MKGGMLTRAEEQMKALERALSREDREILLDMQEKFLETMSFGFRPEVMDILDNEYADQRQIESIKDMLNQAICTRLYGIGNSVYYGRLRKGDVTSFFEVAMRLGTAQTKTYIIMLSLLQIGSSPDTRQLLAKAVATSVIGKIAANRLGLPREGASRVELAGLFLEIGRMIALIYNEKEQKYRLAPDFPDRFNLFIGLKVIDSFACRPILTRYSWRTRSPSTKNHLPCQPSYAWPICWSRIASLRAAYCLSRRLCPVLTVLPQATMAASSRNGLGPWGWISMPK